jgi:hypothetical protein
VLLWADLGAGKTHALRYLEAKAKANPDLVTLFVTTPRGISSFFDVYRACIDGAIAVGALAAAGRDLFDETKGKVSTDVERAIIRIGLYGEEDGRIAQAWLRGDSVQRQAVKELDVTSHIRTPPEAIDALNDLIRILRRGGRTVLLLIDEVQELSDLAPKKQAEAVGGLHKVFDRNPEGLAMVLSFTTASQGTMHNIIGGPLSDRANDTISLPSLSLVEAQELISGLLRHWDVDPPRTPSLFEPQVIASVVGVLSELLPALSPRDVMNAFDAILREADLDIEEGTIATIDEAYALARIPESDSGQAS